MSYFKHPKALVETNEIGPDTRVWAFAHIMKGTRVGSGCNIGDQVFIETGAVVGNLVTVKNGVSIWEKMIVEDRVFIGPNAAFTNDMWPRSKAGGDLLPTLIRYGATVGANSTILCGITIGKFALIGAGSVVTRDVPDYALFFGNPAVKKGYVCECARKLIKEESDHYRCQGCLRVFLVTEDGILTPVRVSKEKERRWETRRKSSR